MDVLDPKMDNLIRASLLKADQAGKLSVIAAVVGIATGEEGLREIMNSEGELSLLDRGMLGMHINHGSN